MDAKTQTVATYNAHAKGYAAKFAKTGPRIADIAAVFTLLKIPTPNVVEIGCGDGRDASVILKFTPYYLGIDISEGMLALARKNVPHGNFEIADVETCRFPKGLNAVFAFASLLHVPRDSFIRILERIRNVLVPGGVVRISLKYADEYAESSVVDEFGPRMFYFYSFQDIQLAAVLFQVESMERRHIAGTEWLEVLLRKPE